MNCGECGTKLEPLMIEDLSGKKIHRTLSYGGKDEPVFFCPNGCKKYQMETETGQRIRKNKPISRLPGPELFGLLKPSAGQGREACDEKGEKDDIKRPACIRASL